MTTRHPVHRTMIQSFRAHTLVSAAPPPVKDKHAVQDKNKGSRANDGKATRAVPAPAAVGGKRKPRPQLPISRRETVMGEERPSTARLLPSARKTAVGGCDEDDGMPRAGDILGGCYRLVRKLGEGMFGQVYEAERTDVPEHRVALKVMRRAAYAGRNVDRELVMLAAAAHPHIVQLKDHGTTPRLVWLTMPLYEGETLEERLSRGRLSLSEAHAIFVPIARGLQSLHDRGMRHQDVKPDNVFLARFGGQLHPMLLDLGVAVEKSASFVAGTALYGAPEQIAALGGLGSLAPLSEKVDGYCLATTLLRALVGPEHFPGEEACSPLKVADSFDERETKPLRDGALPHLTGRPRKLLNEALGRWLRKDPEERPRAGQIAAELDVLLEQEREATRLIEQGVARQKAALSRVRIALGATALVATAGLLYGFSKRETLRLASELQRARAQGAASFDKLDTCVAAHRLSEQQVSSCQLARDGESSAHQKAVAGITRDNEQALAGLTRRYDRSRARLRSCRDDADKERKQHQEESERYDQDRQQWKTATAAQQASFETQQKQWQQQSARKDEALSSCETTKQQSMSAELSCQQQLSQATESSSQCTSRLASAAEQTQSCQTQLMSCQANAGPAPAAAPTQSKATQSKDADNKAEQPSAAPSKTEQEKANAAPNQVEQSKAEQDKTNTAPSKVEQSKAKTPAPKTTAPKAVVPKPR